MASRDRAEGEADAARVAAHDARVPARRRLGRLFVRAVMWSLPAVAAAVALAIWLHSGRYASTDNAYVKGDRVLVAAEVSGPVVEVAVAENQRVARGELLLRIDERPYRIALNRADAELDRQRSDIAALKAAHRQKQEEVKMAQSQLAFAEAEHRRQQDLVQRRFASAQRFEEAVRDLDVAQQRVAMLGEDLLRIVAGLAGDPAIAPEDHPRVRESMAARAEAALNLARTRVAAPIDGVVARRPPPGSFAAAGAPIVAVVADTGLWIEANFKETELERVRAGQQATVRIDGYPDLEWVGTVASVAQATGAEFAILPPQNASGNWVKVVQRIAVRIEVRPGAKDPPLRVGMSAAVDIDTGHVRRLDDVVSTVAKAVGLGGAAASNARPAP